MLDSMNRPIAQLVEFWSPKPAVGGSSPSWPVILKRGTVMKNFKPSVFYSEIKEELQKVSWPTKEQTVGTSIVVLVVVILLCLYLGVVDTVLATIISAIMR